MTTTQTTALLQEARAGSEDAFRRLVDPLRSELHAHCYRMLGSVHDAEDSLQEALLRAWRGLPRFAARSSFRSWLYKIATNTCLDTIAKRPKRVLPIDYGPPADPHDGLSAPLADSVWVEPYPDQMFDIGERLLGPEARYERRESVELAFVAALQNLPARQRAVLILREVLGFSAKEVAEALDSSVQSVNSALQRARKATGDRLPEESQQATLRSLGDERLQELVDRYMAAWEEGDVNGVVALLTEDAVGTMPPIPTWYRGREAVAEFLASWALAGADRRTRLLPTWANGQPAFGGYRWSKENDAYELGFFHVLTLHGGQIREITSFSSSDALEGTGLPRQLPAGDSWEGSEGPV
jgi:RNA polymerase sigma-70 factor (ECF subfamily)